MTGMELVIAFILGVAVMLYVAEPETLEEKARREVKHHAGKRRNALHYG